MNSSAVQIQQRDGEVIAVGPIPSTAPGVTWYNAAGHTASLVIKTDRYAADTALVAGTLAADLAGGWTATYIIPSAVTAAAGRRWMHAWITPTGGEPMTICNRPLHIEAT